MEFYASTDGNRSWGDDLLRAKVVRSSEAADVTIIGNGHECEYDVLYILEDGRKFRDTVNMCEAVRYRVEDGR
jgi:hypothetical protein